MKQYKLKDGKKVILKSKKNIPKKSIIQKIYSKIPDDPKVPIVFQTKEVWDVLPEEQKNKLIEQWKQEVNKNEKNSK